MAVVVVHLLLLPGVLAVLHHEVAEHAEHEEHDDADDLGVDADPQRVGDEGDHEAQGLPHPVVGEGSLFLGREKSAVQSIDLNKISKKYDVRM